jgi:hypothetical protein
MKKIHSYENFVPYYYQFIQQLIDLLGRILFLLFFFTEYFDFLEVSKRDQIIPTIKTLKLLAHTDTTFQWNHTPYQ